MCVREGEEGCIGECDKKEVWISRGKDDGGCNEGIRVVVVVAAAEGRR